VSVTEDCLVRLFLSRGLIIVLMPASSGAQMHSRSALIGRRYSPLDFRVLLSLVLLEASDVSQWP